MDYASRFSNAFVESPLRPDNSSANIDPFGSYRERRLAREDAVGRRDEEQERMDRSIFSSVRDDLKNGASTPGSVAYMYTSAMSEVLNLVRADRLDDANTKMQELKTSADEHSEAYRSYSSTRPRTEFERRVAEGGNAMAQYKFWDQDVKLPDGTETTLGDLFRDGTSYKAIRRNDLLRSNMSPMFVNEYCNTDDTFKKQVLSMVADPVARRTATPGSIPYYSDVGNYLCREWGNLVKELGNNGLQRLVLDVASRRINAGTAIDTINSVRDFVYSQTGGSGAGDDGDVLVRQYLGAFDRVENSVSARLSAPGEGLSYKDNRLFSKIISAVAEGQRKGVANVDLDDPAVMDRIFQLASVVKKAEIRRIPLLVQGTEGGLNMRNVFSDYVIGDTDSNYIRRVDNVFNLSDQMFVYTSHGGTTRGGAAGERVDSDSDSVMKNVADALRSEMSRACVTGMSGGARDDFVVLDLLNNSDKSGSLSGKFASAISANGGLSLRSSSYLADRIIEQSRSGNGGVIPVDLTSLFSTASFFDDCPSDVKAELRRWYKGANLVSDVMQRYKAEYMELLMDNVIGRGLNSKQAEAMWSKVLSDSVSFLSRGRDPGPIMDPLLYSASVYMPTGELTIPGAGVTVNEDEYNRMLKEVTAKGFSSIYVGGDKIDVDFTKLSAARPVVRRTEYPVDLRKTGIPGSRRLGVPNGVPAGAWMDARSRAMFLWYQSVLKQTFLQNNNIETSAEKKARERVATSDPSEPLSI